MHSGTIVTVAVFVAVIAVISVVIIGLTHRTARRRLKPPRGSTAPSPARQAAESAPARRPVATSRSAPVARSAPPVTSRPTVTTRSPQPALPAPTRSTAPSSRPSTDERASTSDTGAETTATTIVTRTGRNTSGHRLADLYAQSDRRWTVSEDIELRDAYDSGLSVREVAQHVRVDQRQVAIRLVQLLLEPHGRIDNDDEMPRARRAYTTLELDTITTEYRAGRSLAEIAEEVGRSQLGVGWRMLDMGLPRKAAD